MSSGDVHFDKILEMISSFSELIKKFTEMIKNFVASWRKVPAAATEDYEYKTPTNA
jgi:archaellum biogenesis protein FlaJ (TadC family)